MNTDKNQMNEEPPAGSGPDKITSASPPCPTKGLRCNYWQDGGCSIAVCWMGENKVDTAE